MIPDLSIIIVNFNTRDDLQRCLESLAAAPPGVSHEIAVVDNASTDGSVDAVRSRWPSVQVLPQSRNLGFSAANNVGIRATSGRLVLLLNSDTVVPAGALDALIARLEANPAAGAAGPRLIDGDGRAELSFGAMITPFTELRRKTVLALYQRGLGPVRRWVERATRRERWVDWVSGAVLLVSRADAEAVGLLDERYFIYTEDVDFCAAIRARGRRILFTPAAEIVHLRGRARLSAPVVINTGYRRSQLAFYEKHHPRWLPLLEAYLRLKGQLPERTGAARR
jgi:GT2 family glycosyltransferase